MDSEGLRRRINQILQDFFEDHQPSELYQPMGYVMGLERQRFHAMLTLWGCYLHGGDPIAALIPAAGIEVFHGFLMVHGDLLDGNPRHKNKKSVHTKWNRNVAILSGDAMVFKAYELMIQVDPGLVKPIVRMFNRCFTQVCEQKQLSITQGTASTGHSVQNLHSKTLTSFCLQMGATIAGASEQQVEDLGSFGAKLGMSFDPANQSKTITTSTQQAIDTLDCREQFKRQFKSWVLSIEL